MLKRTVTQQLNHEQFAWLSLFSQAGNISKREFFMRYLDEKREEIPSPNSYIKKKAIEKFSGKEKK